MRAVVAVLVGLTLMAGCGEGGGGKTARQIQEDAERAGKTDDTDYSEVGVDIYPGSKVPAELPALMRSIRNGELHIDVFRETSASVDEVAAFYKERLVEPTETKGGSGVSIEGATSKGDRVYITANRPAKATVTAVVISVIVKSDQGQKPTD